MTDLRKAAEMALEALERGTTGLAIRAIPALRQALAQPEPQVCCGDYEKCIKACTPRGRWLANQQMTRLEQEKGQFVGGIPEVSQQREWVGLTDDEIQDILDCGRGGLINIKKAEQMLKEKITHEHTTKNP